MLAGLLALTAWETTRSTALDEAQRAYHRRDLNTALRRALDHLGRRPLSHGAAVLAARCLSELDYAVAAEPYYRRARATGGLGVDDRHRRAYALVRSNERERARAAYEEILRDRPNDAIALQRLATVFYSMQGYDQGRTLAERLTLLPGGAGAGYALLGTIDHEEGKRPQAIAAYERLLAIDPSLSGLPFPASLFWTELTGDLIAEGRPEEASRLLRDGLNHRDDATLHYLRGRAERAAGQSDEAEACCRRALERDPGLGGAWLLLGQLALHRQQPDKALELLNRAEAVDPDRFETATGLQLAHRQLGHLAEAARFAGKVQQLRRRAGLGRPAPGSP